MTLPNGIKLSYGYDNANELTGLTYTLGTGKVGTMTYGYDSDGRIINRGGTFDITNLPAALASATYDANNRLTKWGRQAVSYDADGNLVSNGKNTYTWNTRNQLTGISGSTTASFLYDALGRRESKTIGSTATNFLYDGLNLEQELNGTTPTVNYLTGVGIDEVFNRTDSSGAYSYLTDNLGSTLAFTNSSGAVSTSYSYDSYGNTTASGASSTNAIQYTGRENDGTGLYYYRARYYSPVYGRFISEDPIGLLGGVNEYGYASGNPINLDDPLGLDSGMQFPLPVRAPTDFAGAQAMAEEQSAQAQFQVAQYHAMQVELQAAQCLAKLWVANYHQYQGPFQSELGPIEAISSIGHVVAHATEISTELTAVGSFQNSAIEDRMAGDLVGAAKWTGRVAATKFLSHSLFAIGAGEDLGSMIDATYYTITRATNCCSIH